MQSVTITTNVVSSNPVHCEVYSIQHNVLKFVNVGSFLRELRFPPPIKTDRQDIAEILLKVALSTLTPPAPPPHTVTKDMTM
jgi:hypothetical protein